MSKSEQQQFLKILICIVQNLNHIASLGFTVCPLGNTATLPLDTLNFTLGMNAPLLDISYPHAEEVSL